MTDRCHWFFIFYKNRNKGYVAYRLKASRHDPPKHSGHLLATPVLKAQPQVFFAMYDYQQLQPQYRLWPHESHHWLGVCECEKQQRWYRRVSLPHKWLTRSEERRVGKEARDGT